MENLLPELKRLVFLHLPDAHSVYSLMRVSRSFYYSYTTNSVAINKSVVHFAVEDEVFKLAVMALESKKIDVTDYAAMDQFFVDYVHHNEWEERQYSLSTAAQLLRLHTMIRELKNHANPIIFYGFPILETPSENIRKLRAYYMVEIDANLFGQMFNLAVDFRHIKSPIWDYMKRYLDTFSRGEARTAEDILVYLLWNFGSALMRQHRRKARGMDTQEDTELLSQMNVLQSNPILIPELYVRYLGIENLHSALFGTYQGTLSQGILEHFAAFCSKVDNEFFMLPSSAHLSQTPSPRVLMPFYPDDLGTWREEFYEYNHDDLLRYYHNNDQACFQSWTGTESLWDDSTLEAYKPQDQCTVLPWPTLPACPHLEYHFVLYEAIEILEDNDKNPVLKSSYDF